MIILISSMWVDFQKEVLHLNVSHGKSFSNYTLSIKGHYQCLGEGRTLDTEKVEPGFS